ncbi:putative cation-transporting ATPase [Operophtera brumata]|uniref:Cation-transporting ATPase n=1 Tax=Operophtera brumata TaxID=104452 RepID=A0A0L7L9C2_OPEBR|nr:putative cation-transporting ATPase [Operophtera brumata]
MDSEDDIQPLISYEGETSRELLLELTVQHIDTDPEFEQVVYGYRNSRWRTALVWLFSVLTAGVPFLVFHWVPTWRLYATSRRKHTKRNAKVTTYTRYWKRILRMPDVLKYRYFRHKKQNLIWDTGRAQWTRLAGIESGATCAQLHAAGARPPSSERRIRMLNIYGLNEIKVPVQSIMTLILLEVFNPFYVFQVFTIGVWLAEPYYYYCVAVVLMSTFGVATSVIQTKKNQTNLRATVEAHDTVELWDGRTVDSRSVAPGDIVVLPPRGCTLHFDAALLTGSAVLNESMLTGESVPVTKTALLRVDKPFDMKEHAASILFCGTRVIQTRYYNNEPVKALVLRTGYNTSKGQLVRSILYPVPADFKFDRDSYKFIIILAFIAVFGLAYTVALKAYRSLTPGDIAIKALDIITIVIPPALPAAMTVGRLYAVSRLQRARVACLNTRAVNVSGSIDCVAFDKTGTLTEDGLDMWGVVPASQATAPVRLGAPLRDPRALNDLHELKLGMATCHSLTLLDGVLCGDPLDLKMFESTGWTLEEPDVPEPSKYEILMPTVVKPRKLLGETVARVYCKGAPEMLRKLCQPHTVPDNLDEVLSSYAEKGFRVIAIASRMMEITLKQTQTMTRDEVECELQFLGLVIMENRLKPASAAIIKELKEANIHVVMITGDNIHTAVSVAKECGILTSGERVVHLQAEGATDRGGAPAVYCESTVHGVLLCMGYVHILREYCAWGTYIYCESTVHGVGVGHRTILPREWMREDSGRGSWRSALAAPGDCEASPGAEPRYKIVMTGDTWRVLREHYPDVLSRVVARGAVFARMSSDQKQQLIVEYQALGYYLESSVAAPFTSQHPDIVCVARVLREGRAALSTSFGVFKFMIAYSLTEFFSVAFLYYFDSNLTDFQFLYIDVALIVNFAFFFGMTEAYSGKLCKVPPLTSLLGLIPLLSLVGQLCLIGVGQYLSYYALTMFPWYVRHTYEGEEANECWENYSIYAVSMFQYITLAIVFSHGSPYRKSVVTNRQLMASVLLMTAVCVYIAVSPAEWLAKFLQLRMPNDILLSYVIIAIASIYFVVALFFERVIIEYCMERKQFIPKFLKEKKVRKTPHLMIKRELSDTDYLDCESSLSLDREVRVSDSSSGKE